MSNRKTAGIILIVLGVFPLAIWYIYLTTAVAPGSTLGMELANLIAEGAEYRFLFYISTTFALASFIAAYLYLSHYSGSRSVLLILAVFCTSQAVVALSFTQFEISIIYVISSVFSIMAYFNPNKSLNQTGAHNAPPG